MPSSATVRRRLGLVTRRLELYLRAAEAILDGAQSYAIGSRNLTRADLSEITEMIDALLKEKEELEAMDAGGSRRKSVGVYLRDW